jgi:hypothetical protein
MIVFLLILHGLCAVALLGAITHQTFSAWVPARKAIGFVPSFRAVQGAKFTNAIIILFIITFVLGALIYPPYRLNGRTYLETMRMWTVNGSFELKEQFLAIGLGMLPFYWHVWRESLDETLALARKMTSALICFSVWFGFLAGHVVNNVRGIS